jgi:hypothetical protein
VRGFDRRHVPSDASPAECPTGHCACNLTPTANEIAVFYCLNTVRIAGNRAIKRDVALEAAVCGRERPDANQANMTLFFTLHPTPPPKVRVRLLHRLLLHLSAARTVTGSPMLRGAGDVEPAQRETPSAC